MDEISVEPFSRGFLSRGRLQPLRLCFCVEVPDLFREAVLNGSLAVCGKLWRRQLAVAKPPESRNLEGRATELR